MKFYLNEKYILEERNILNEDEASDEAEKMKAIENEKAEIDSNKTKKDWKSLLQDNINNMSELKKIWADYYNTEWEKNSEKVKALGTAFQNDLLKNGFSANTNALVKFVKDNINSITFSLSVFAELVKNYRVESTISDKDLLGVGALGKDNIIFNSEFYKLDPAVAGKFLDIQQKIKSDDIKLQNSAAKNNFSEDESDVKLRNKAEFLKTLFYVGGDPTAVNKVVPTSKVFKKESEVLELFKLCTGISTQKQAEKIPFEIESIFKTVNPKNLNDYVLLSMALIWRTDDLTAAKFSEVLSKLKNQKFKTELANSFNLKNVADSFNLNNKLSKFASPKKDMLITIINQLSDKAAENSLI